MPSPLYAQLQALNADVNANTAQCLAIGDHLAANFNVHVDSAATLDMRRDILMVFRDLQKKGNMLQVKDLLTHYAGINRQYEDTSGFIPYPWIQHISCKPKPVLSAKPKPVLSATQFGQLMSTVVLMIALMIAYALS